MTSRTHEGSMPKPVTRAGMRSQIQRGVAGDDELLGLVGAEGLEVAKEHAEHGVTIAEGAIVDGLEGLLDGAVLADDADGQELGLAPGSIVAAMTGLGTTSAVTGGTALANASPVGGDEDALATQRTRGRGLSASLLQPCIALLDGAAAEVIDDPQGLLVPQVDVAAGERGAAGTDRVAVGDLLADLAGQGGRHPKPDAERGQHGVQAPSLLCPAACAGVRGARGARA